MIDQFIASGEAKWRRSSGLTMLLPHGYEGMGPEHSSARLERFLQLCSEDESVYPVMDHFARTQIERCNIQVVNCTTPANYFHILRRQVHREFRKPLVVFTPKSMLRLPEAQSKIVDIGPGTRFLRLIPETDREILLSGPNAAVRRVIFCQGKVYYDLLKARNDAGIKDVAIARIEQISPFPFDLVHRHADNFPNAEVVWCQEEPRNMGAWAFIDPRFDTALSKSEHHTKSRVRYVGRPPSAATATGDKVQHKKEQEKFISKALA
jgi:2-oxoglutarate dehydrogenase E1 component